jgi:hypothetical protein
LLNLAMRCILKFFKSLITISFIFIFDFHVILALVYLGGILKISEVFVVFIFSWFSIGFFAITW